MKKWSKFIIMTVWATLIYILFRCNLLTGNLNTLNQALNNSGYFKELIFILLATLRIVAFIPSAVFMILGGVIFGPVEGAGLTFISLVLSETIIFVVSKILVHSNMQNYLVKKNPKLYNLLLKNNTKILAIGVLCPIAPSDAACFLAGSTGLSYRKFMLIVVLANMPMMILYSFLGNNVLSSAGNSIIIAVIIAVMSIYTIHLWNKEQRAQRFA